jgi:hypothetical protein
MNDQEQAYVKSISESNPGSHFHGYGYPHYSSSTAPADQIVNEQILVNVGPVNTFAVPDQLKARTLRLRSSHQSSRMTNWCANHDTARQSDDNVSSGYADVGSLIVESGEPTHPKPPVSGDAECVLPFEVHSGSFHDSIQERLPEGARIWRGLRHTARERVRARFGPSYKNSIGTRASRTQRAKVLVSVVSQHASMRTSRLIGERTKPVAQRTIGFFRNTRPLSMFVLGCEHLDDALFALPRGLSMRHGLNMAIKGLYVKETS